MHLPKARRLLLGAVLAVVLLGACGSSTGGGRAGEPSTTTTEPALCDPLMGAGKCRDTTRQVICDYAADSGTFAGGLVAKRGAVATFRIASVRAQATGATSHVPVVGTLIAVRYENGEARFLTVGRDYTVRVWWLGPTPATRHFLSSVHTDARVCSGGTIYVDGTPIDTR